MQYGEVNEWRTHVLGATALHVAMGDCRITVMSYHCTYNRSLTARLDVDLRHVRLIHAQGTEFEKIRAQQRFREEARYVSLSADKFDTDLAAFDVVAMFGESNDEVFVPPRIFRIDRSEDASQVVTVDWRRRNEHSIRPMVSGRFLALGHHIKFGNARNDKATPASNNNRNQMLSPEQEDIAMSSAS